MYSPAWLEPTKLMALMAGWWQMKSTATILKKKRKNNVVISTQYPDYNSSKTSFFSKNFFFIFFYTRMLSVDDVQRSIWSTSVLQELGQHHGAARDSLWRLQQVSVSTHHAHWEHPQRNHSREIERGDAGTHTKGQPVCVCIHVFGDRGESLTQHEGGDTTGVLHHLCENNKSG